MSDATRARATTILGLGPTDPGSDAVSAFLAALPASGFVPSSDQVAAVNALAGTSVPHDLAECDSDLDRNAQVEEFACAFWSLAPAERRAKWHALRAVAGEGPAARRLDSLHAGLDIDPTRSLGGEVQEFATLACELFILAPTVRAARRNAWLLAKAERHGAWYHLARQFEQLCPDLAALDPVLLSRLTARWHLAAMAEGVAAVPRLVTENEERQGETKAAIPVLFRWPEENSPHHATASTQTTSGGAEDFRWAIYILIAILVAVGKLAGTNRSHTPSLDPPRPYTAPIIPVMPRGPGEFTPEKVAEFRRFEKSDSGRVPVGYAEWVRRERPDPVHAPAGPVPLGTHRVTISPTDVEECLRHETLPWLVPPENYAKWVTVGSPRSPGEYLLRRP